MSSELVVSAKNIGKCYHIYQHPRDRLMQTLCGNRVKLYKDFWALKDISFEMKAGEALGIIGRNGSGKSTLLQILSGILTPTTGNFIVNGKVAALLELGAGFNPEFTGRENVFMCGMLYQLSHAEIQQRFDKIAQFAEIGDFIDRPVKMYSSGMYVRLAFAIIAHIDADILIIDEALSVGDVIFSQKCTRFLHQFREKSGTLVFVSHDSGAVINLCNRALWLNEGHLLMDGSPKDVTDAYLAFSYEQHQGKSSEKLPKKIDLYTKNNTADAVIAPSVASFGSGQAYIFDVWLEDESAERRHRFFGNEKISLHVCAKTDIDVEQPIVGFQVKDRLGQIIFGQNTFSTYKNDPLVFEKENIIHAVFTFTMPIMQGGAYSIAIAIANGTQENHVQLHWLHDGLVFEMHPDPNYHVSGLIDVPMEKILMFEDRSEMLSEVNV